MLGLRRTNSGVADKPEIKAQRYKKVFRWDARANRGRGAYTKTTRR
tara:strand:+ start:3440 stop:3577 length:138 start_codon:yes stop_codon:yes gene_type:complete